MFKIKTPLYIDGFDSSDYMISFQTTTQATRTSVMSLLLGTKRKRPIRNGLSAYPSCLATFPRSAHERLDGYLPESYGYGPQPRHPSPSYKGIHLHLPLVAYSQHTGHQPDA